MSARDLQLLKALSMKYVEAEKIFDLSRQTISRKTNDPNTEFFNLGRLRKLYARAEEVSDEEARVIFSVIRQIYPEFRANMEEDQTFPQAGEFWLACRSLADFEARYPKCFDELLERGQITENKIVLFVPESEHKRAHRFLARILPKGSSRNHYPCDATFDLMLPTLLHVGNEGNVGVYIGGDRGFVVVGEPDARFIKSRLDDWMSNDVQ